MIPNVLQNVLNWPRIVALSGLLGVGSILPSNAQTSCADITTPGQLTISPATCEGNGQIVVPSFSGATYILSGGAISGETTQTNNTFESLNAGTYTLKILCEGANTPTVISSIVVPDQHEPLALALSSSYTCETKNTITAQATLGHNRGVDAGYRFAIWKNENGNAGRPDNQLTYGNVSVDGTYSFANLEGGTYHIRVKDNCQNYFTRSLTVSSIYPNVPLGIKGSWACTNDGPVYRVTGNLSSVAPPSTIVGYKFKIDEVENNSSNCDLKTFKKELIPVRTISDQASVTVDLPSTVKYFRITTISPCGEQRTECHEVPDQIRLLIRPTYAGCNSASYSRLSYEVLPSLDKNDNPTPIQYPVTVTVTGQGQYTTTATIPNVAAAAGIFDDVPLSAYPITVTATDACGLTRSQGSQPGFGDGTLATKHDAFELNYECVDIGKVNLQANFNGNYIGIGLPTTTYELLDNTGAVVATGFVKDPNTNLVRFPNITLNGQAYQVRITVPGCTVQLVDIGKFGGGMFMTTNPIVTGSCTEDKHTMVWNHLTNVKGYSSREFKVTGTTSKGAPFLYSSPNPNVNVELVSGTYTWTASTLYNEGEHCNHVQTGTFTITASGIAPTISKIFATTCQEVDGTPLATGMAIIDFSGNGPFTIEQSEDGGNTFTVAATGVTNNSYKVSNLVAGKTYLFRITDRCGVSVTQQASVKPLSPRIISSDAVQPCVNTNYSIEGLEYPLATYSWVRVSDGQVVSTARNLSFAPFTATDAGKYKLTILISECVVRETTISIVADACGQPFQSGSIGQYVWFDTDRDGIRDGEEAIAPNVEVTLEAYVGPASPSSEQLATEGNWTAIETKRTDSAGQYLFEDLETGYYRVRFNAPTNYTFTSTQAAGVDADNRLNNTDSNADAAGLTTPIFINTELSGTFLNNLTIDAGLVATGSIGSRVWFDENSNGTIDPSENGVEGIVISLEIQNSEGNWIPAGTTVTSANGTYLFDNLASGIYRVHFPSRASFEFTLRYGNNNDATDSNADRSTGFSETIVINADLPVGNAGRNRLDVHAGYITPGALPVRLNQFNVKANGEGGATVLWTTTAEENSAYFIVQQSVNGQNWNAIGEVKANGTSATTKSYEFIDNQPNNGLNYYRLKMVDLDGSYDYSMIRSVRVTGARNVIQLYPNPVVDYVQVNSGTRNEVAKVEILDTNGRLVLTDATVYPGKKISVKGLKAGAYLFKVTFDNGGSAVRHVVIGR